MKKQYWVSREHNFKRRVVIFHDDKPVSLYDSFIDEVDNFIKDIEKQGYTKGYLPSEVKAQWYRYKEMGDNIIEFEETNDTYGES